MPDILTLLPGKTLIEYIEIPTSALQIISQVVKTDEGGWQLTVDGRDGGWTFGGMTSRKFSEYYGTYSKTYVANMVDSSVFKEAVLRIYYQDFFLPVKKILFPLQISMADYFFSCAINCGIGGFSSVFQVARAVTSYPDKMAFLTAWKDRYFGLLKLDPVRNEPVIHGWIQRVWRYVG